MSTILAAVLAANALGGAPDPATLAAERKHAAYMAESAALLRKFDAQIAESDKLNKRVAADMAFIWAAVASAKAQFDRLEAAEKAREQQKKPAPAKR